MDEETIVVSVIARTDRYTIVVFPQGTAICCLRCLKQGFDALSFNPNDVQAHYCGRCHLFHDEVT